MLNNIFLKFLLFMRQSGKLWYSRAGHKRQYGACALLAG